MYRDNWKYKNKTFGDVLILYSRDIILIVKIKNDFDI